MENHEEYGNVMAGIIGVDAPQRRDDAIYDQFFAGFNARLPEAVAQAAYDLESTAVATHTDLIGQLVGLDGAATLGGPARGRVTALHGARSPGRQWRRHGRAARELGLPTRPGRRREAER